MLRLLFGVFDLLNSSLEEKQKKNTIQMYEHKLEKLSNGRYKYPILGGEHWFEGIIEDGKWKGQVEIKHIYDSDVHGRYVESTIGYYEGEWRYGVPHGNGRLDGIMYFGVLLALYYESKGYKEIKYQDDFFHYNTHRFWNRAESYNGEFLNGLPHGFGKAYRRNHNSNELKIWYEGDFNNAYPVNFDFKQF